MKFNKDVLKDKTLKDLRPKKLDKPEPVVIPELELTDDEIMAVITLLRKRVPYSKILRSWYKTITVEDKDYRQRLSKADLQEIVKVWKTRLNELRPKVEDLEV